MFNSNSTIVLAILIISNLAYADLTTGLVAHYTFDDCTAKDVSGNGYDGLIHWRTTSNCVVGVRGIGAFLNYVDGVNEYGFKGGEYVSLPTFPAVWINGFTGCTWASFQNDDRNYERLFDIGNGAATDNILLARWATSTTPYFLSYSGSSYTSYSYVNASTIVDNTFKLYCGTIDGAAQKLRLYVDGVKVTEGNGNYNNVERVSNFIGRSNWHAFDADFRGIIDDVRFYSRALTDTEILQLYQEGTAQQLTITKAGTGTGTVTSNPSGINCGTACNANFTSGTNVTLTATPQTIACITTPCPSNIWSGWSGACTGTANTCTVTMTAAKTVTATFNFVDVPTATTLPASNIAATSATLNGTVASNGNTATVSFDFGTSLSYGQTIVATPAQVYSATAVAVTANKTDLTCSSTYHYRVKAVNSTGTKLGADQTFTTTACPPVNSWLSPPNKNVLRDRPFTLEVTANSNSMKISAYEFIVTFDSNKLTLDQSLCNKGVCKGSYGLPTNQVVINTTNSAANTIKITGLSNAGEETGPGNDLQLLIINFKSRTTLGSTPVNLTTNKLDNSSGDSIGTTSRGTTVNVKTGICGDSDGNTIVNIVDALSIARTLVKLPPPPTVNDWLADVDQNDTLSIADALHLARYSVGLVLMPGVCAIGVAL
jgi:hypothetical protein